jgi:hypothetical protein
MDESIRNIIQTLGRREVKFLADRDANARELSGQQPSFWSNLASRLQLPPNLDHNSRVTLQNFFASLLQDIKNSPQLTVDQDADGDWIVHSKYPILETQFMDEAVKYTDILIGGIIVEMCNSFATLGRNTATFNNIVTHPFFSLSCMKYMTLKEAERSTKAGEAILKDMQEQAGSVRGAAQLSYHEAKKSIENMKASVETHISESRSELEQKIVNLSDNISKLEEEIPRIKQLAHESAALNSSKEIWEKRISKYKITHWVWLGLITILIGIFVGLIVAFGGDYIKKFPTKTDGDYGYVVILLSIIPIIAIAWLLKFFGRIVSNALVLKEDAELRDAMLNTYFALIGDPEAKFDSKERILIINAIFRPLPGHQSEDIAPPTLADLAKEQLGMGKDKT